jgi:hypothetical protein
MHPYIPVAVNGPIQDITITNEILHWWPWIADIKNKSVYLMLCAQWKWDGSYPDAPPPGYDYYITHGDSYMFGFPEYIAPKVNGKIIHLTGSIMPDLLDTNQIQYVSYNNIHQRIAGIPRTPRPFKKNIQYKASALNNRVTQSKAIVFAALKQYLGDDCVAALHHNLYRPKDIHSWEPTSNDVCNNFSELFQTTWNHQKLQLPEDDGVEGSYNNTAYRCAALNFTQESYHYSFTQHNGRNLCRPGPFITEKTWKCLLSGTAFISVGQAHVYRWLRSLGLQFDYGPLDLTFDEDVGDLTRLEKIVTVIKSLQAWSADDLYEMTKASTEYNREYVDSNAFRITCERTNESVHNMLANL